MQRAQVLKNFCNKLVNGKPGTPERPEQFEAAVWKLGVRASKSSVTADPIPSKMKIQSGLDWVF